MSREKRAWYKVEEFHRGEWMPFMTRKEGSKDPLVQRVVAIPVDTAERLNEDKGSSKFRYVEIDVKEVKKIQKQAEKEAEEAEKEAKKAEKEAEEKAAKEAKEAAEAEKEAAKKEAKK